MPYSHLQVLFAAGTSLYPELNTSPAMSTITAPTFLFKHEDLMLAAYAMAIFVSIYVGANASFPSIK